MRLVELQLENFRQYEKAVVRFEPGITAIIGANGAGKTTLIEAILWVLYGAEAKRGDNLSLRWLWSKGEAKVRVLLTFELGGRLYQAQRTLQSAHLSLRDDSQWRPITTGLVPVTRKVEGLLGMNLRQFQTSFCARQKELEFMAYEKERRREEISRMLGYERVTESIDQIKQELTALRREVEGLQAGLGDPKGLETQIKEARKQLKTQEKAIQAAVQAYEEARGAMEEIEPRKRELEAAQRVYQELATRETILTARYADLRAQLEQARRRWEQLQADQRRLREIRPALDTYLQMQKRLKEIEALAQYEHERVQLQSQIAASEEQIQSLQKQRAELETKARRLETLKPSLEKYTRLQTELKTLRQQAQQAGERSKLQTLLEQHHLSLQQLQTQVRALDERAVELEALQEELRHCQQLQQEKEARYNALRDEWNRQQSAVETERQAVEKEWEAVERQQKELEALGEEGICPTCKRLLGADFGHVLARYQEQLHALEERLQSLKRQAKALQREPAEMKRLQEELATLHQHILHLERQQAQLKSEVEQRDRLQREIENHQEKILHLQRQLSALPEYDPDREQAVQQKMEELQSLQEEAIALQHELRTLPDIQQSLQEQQTRRERLQKKLATLPTGYDPAEHEQVRRQSEQLQPLYEEALQIQARRQEQAALHEHIQQLKADRKAVEEERKEVQSQIERLAYSEEVYRQVLNEYERRRSKWEEAREQLNRLQAEQKGTHTLLHNLEAQYEEYQQRAKHLEAKKQELLLKESLSRALQAFRVELNTRLQPLLANYASEFLSQLTNGRYTQIEIDEQYNFHLCEEGVPKTVISGGETDIVNLSLRLALARLITERAGQPLSLLILDEVFGSLDTERRQNVLEVLRRLRDWFQQILVISHIEDINEAADHCLWVIHDERHRRSRIVERPPIEEEAKLDAPVNTGGVTLGGLFQVGS